MMMMCVGGTLVVGGMINTLIVTNIDILTSILSFPFS